MTRTGSRGRPPRGMNDSMFSIPVLALTAFAMLQGSDAATRKAPDGHPGLGAQTTLADVLSLVRSSRDEDRAFFSGLRALASDVRLDVAATAQRYRKQGYFAALDAKQEPTIDALNAALTEIDAKPFERLLTDAAGARPVARLLLDARARARKTVLEGWDFELRELEDGLAVFQGATDGYVELTQNECSNIASRVDLAASMLRAMRNDVTALRPGDADPQAEHASEEAVDRLIAEASAAEGEGVRRAAVERTLEGARTLATKMESSLFTPRLVVQLAQLLEWRARIFDQTKPVRDEVLLWLPDSEQGRSAPAEIAKLAKFERMRQVAWKAREGLGFDPLDPDLTWAAAHALDFQNGLIESRPFYDRFLALRRIRAHDHRTVQGRELDTREREALDAVQRSIVPTPGKPARF